MSMQSAHDASSFYLTSFLPKLLLCDNNLVGGDVNYIPNAIKKNPNLSYLDIATKTEHAQVCVILLKAEFNSTTLNSARDSNHVQRFFISKCKSSVTSES